MAELEGLMGRLEAAVSRLERCGPPSTPLSPSANGFAFNPERRQSRVWQQWGETSTAPFVVAYDTLLTGPFKDFLDKSNQIGDHVAEMAKLVETAFKAQRAFLVTASKSTKPSAEELPKVLDGLSKQIQAIIAFRDAHRTSPLINHLSTVSESIPGLGWVAVEPAPAPYCREMLNAAVFYSNRVLKDYREKNKLHVEWVGAWTAVFSELGDYIKQHHTTGVAWNPRGSSALSNTKPNIPPPPGGVPPPPPLGQLQPAKPSAPAPTAQLFQDINKGLDITSKLKKVSDDQKTHKNPALREGPKPFAKGGSARSVAPAAPVAKPPRLVLEGKKWFVEYQKDNKDICVKDTSMEHCVYVYKCEGSVLQVKGKVNSIILDSCKKTAVVFDSLVSSLEIVNCQSCQAQVLQCVPTIAIEKTDGAMVYLSQASLGAEIITAKSTEMNILLPNASGEFSELAVPEQFKTVIEGGRLVTTCTEKAG